MEAGDVVCDIQRDKAVVSMEADEDGVLAKILKSDDSGAIKVDCSCGRGWRRMEDSYCWW